MGFDQMHIRHCILYKFKRSSKASQAARNIRSVYKTRPRVSELVNNVSNNLNQETLPSKTPFNKEDQVLSLLRF